MNIRIDFDQFTRLAVIGALLGMVLSMAVTWFQ